MVSDTVFVRFGSHRARDYGLRAIGRHPQAFWSLRRNTHPGGVYEITEAEVSVIQQEPHARFTRLRGPFDDLRRCWDGT